MAHVLRLLVSLLASLALAACSTDVSVTQQAEPSAPASVAPSPSEPSTSPATRDVRTELPPGVAEPPAWLGERPLPIGPDGLGIAHSTPVALRDRRLVTRDYLPPPAGRRFSFSIGAVPTDVLRRSTWQRRCPVAARDLGYVTVSFWGFDRAPHTGELIVARGVARDIASVFRALYRARWPIEEMRVTSRAELNAPPTGDGNNTSAFVCRPARLSADWSQHAYGLALDVNPFHNPYVRDDLVLPERAIAYRYRGWRRPGMIHAGDVVTRAFARIGWGWGGEWTSAKDWMHFSRSGA